MRKTFFSLIAASVALSPLYGYASGSNVSTDTKGATRTVNTTVTGTVVDDSGEPLPGATVILDGTRQGTSTDIDGKFSLNVKGGSNASLTVSYIGMKPQTVSLSAYSGKPLHITLQFNAAVMDEVVVTGYQEIKKEKMTGATTTLSAEKLDQ
ncbi:MAG: carboxypeptidase-like regulatory domain-containing protein, partial [Duncaniella sp.]|nr:carboxypeptidase-like regulatory domain-containing protein [Duncaniella sp.]